MNPLVASILVYLFGLVTFVVFAGWLVLTAIRESKQEAAR